MFLNRTMKNVMKFSIYLNKRVLVMAIYITNDARTKLNRLGTVSRKSASMSLYQFYRPNIALNSDDAPNSKHVFGLQKDHFENTPIQMCRKFHLSKN